MYIPSFGSDNHASVHPRILEAMAEVNRHQVPSYGTDHWSLEASKVFERAFGKGTESYLVFNGTAANVLALRAMVTNYQSVFCSDVSHLMQDECGAPEHIAGVKLIPVPSHQGKISVEELEKLWVRRGDQHYSQTQGLSITQPTELGTVYSMEELRDIVGWAKAKNIRVHLDGARIANAAVSLGQSFQAFTREIGIDIVSFGGSKNGLMLGEAIVILNPALAKDFRYIRKQSLQLPSKSRFIAAQFLAYLGDGRGGSGLFGEPLWENIARSSMTHAQSLYRAVQSIPEVHIEYPIESNALFARIPRGWVKPLREKYFFYIWDEKTTLCRWMTSWDTEAGDVAGFAEALKSSVSGFDAMR